MRMRTVAVAVVMVAVTTGACSRPTEAEAIQRLTATEVRAGELLTRVMGADVLEGWQRSEVPNFDPLCQACAASASRLPLGGPNPEAILQEFGEAAEQLGATPGPIITIYESATRDGEVINEEVIGKVVNIAFGDGFFELQIHFDPKTRLVTAHISTGSYEAAS